MTGHSNNSAQAFPSRPSTQELKRKQRTTPSQESAQRKGSTKPINIEPSAENVMKSETDDSFTDSKEAWDPERAKKKRQELRQLLKVWRQTQMPYTPQQQLATDRGTVATSRDTEPRRSRSKSPSRKMTPRHIRSRSPPRHKRTRSNSPPRRSLTATSRRSRPQVPPKASQDERPPTKKPTTRRSSPQVTRPDDPHQGARPSPARRTSTPSLTPQQLKTGATSAEVVRKAAKACIRC